MASDPEYVLVTSTISSPPLQLVSDYTRTLIHEVSCDEENGILHECVTCAVTCAPIQDFHSTCCTIQIHIVERICLAECQSVVVKRINTVMERQLTNAVRAQSQSPYGWNQAGHRTDSLRLPEQLWYLGPIHFGERSLQ